MIQDQFSIIQNLQRSLFHKPVTVQGLFFATWYNNPALISFDVYCSDLKPINSSFLMTLLSYENLLEAVVRKQNFKKAKSILVDPILSGTNVHFVKKNTKRSSNTLLCLVSFFKERTLGGISPLIVYHLTKPRRNRVKFILILVISQIVYQKSEAIFFLRSVY